MNLRLCVTASLLLASAVLIGCPPSGGPVKGPLATQPSTPIAQEPVLDAKALTPLAELKPVLAKPTTAPATTGPASSDPSVVRAIDEAEKALTKKDYSGAKKALDRAIGFEPGNPRILRDMAMALVGLQNSGNAIKYLQKSAAATPDDLEVQILRGRLLLDQPEQAIIAFRTALLTSKAQPDNPLAAEALLHLGNLLGKTRQYRASLDAYNQLSKWLETNADNYTNNPSLKPLLARPEDLLLRRGTLMLKLQMPHEAAEVLDKAYSGDHGNEEIARTLTDALIKDKQYDRAAKLILEMASQPGQQQQIVPRAETLVIASGKKNLPMLIWQEYLKTGKKETTLALAMAEVSRKTGDAQQAQQILASAMEKQPGSIAIGKSLVNLLISSQQYDDAVARLAEIVARDASQIADAVSMLRRISTSAPADYHRQLARKYSSNATAAQGYLSGLLANLRNDRGLALQQINLALTRDPNFLPAYEAIFDLAVAQGQVGDAQKVVARTDKLDEAQFGYFKTYMRARLNLLARNWDGAIKELQAARQAKGNYVPALRLLAQVYMVPTNPPNPERQQEAQGLLIQALRADPDSEETYRMLLGALLQKGDITNAQQLLVQLQERRPDSIVARIGQVEILLIANQRPEAVKLIETLKKTTPDNAQVQWLDFRIQYGDKFQNDRIGRLVLSAQLADKEWSDAVERLHSIIRADANQTQAMQYLAVLLQAPGHEGQKMENWARVYRESNKSLLPAKIYAEVLITSGKAQEGLQIVQDLYNSSPRDVELRRLLFQALKKLGKNDDLVKLAEGWLAEAQDESERSFYRNDVLNLYEEAKQYDKAQKLLDDWLLLSADGAATLQLKRKKLEFFGAAKQYDKAVEFAQSWIAEYRADAQAARAPRLLLLATLAEGKQYDKALTLLEEFITKDKEAAALWQNEQILMLGRAGQFDKGRKIALEMIAKNPEDTDARQSVVLMYRAGDKPDEAIKILDSWLADPAKLKPIVIDWCRLSTVQLLLAKEMYSDAIKRIDEYVPLYKDWKPEPPPPPQPNQPPYRPRTNPSIELQYYKGNALGELGQKDQQIALLEKLIAQFPESSLLQNDLGYTLADAGLQLDRAEQLIRRAQQQDNSASVQDSLGWVLYKKGKFDQALNTFTGIINDPKVRDEGNTGVIFDHAGDVAYRAGQKDKAVELWGIALKKASKEEHPDRETRRVKASAAAKIEAVKKNKEPALAPVPPPPATKPVKPAGK